MRTEEEICEFLVEVLFDQGKSGLEKVKGQCLLEWIVLEQEGYDEVDRLLIDHDTIGG